MSQRPDDAAGLESLSPSSPPPQEREPLVPSTGSFRSAVRPSDSIVSVTPSGAMRTPTEAHLGLVIDDRYEVESFLGGGNIGVVYRARHTVIDKRVAIKFLRTELARDGATIERFLIEAKAASSIDNPHVINISDYGRLPDGTAYIVMDFLDGRPLSDLIQQCCRVPAARMIHIAKQIAEGLEAAHTKSIIHRDLKPDNLILTRRGDVEDFVTIVDFGIAKVTGLTSQLTVAGMMYGTPHYMSPEQAQGKPVDHRSDIYALGVILYEMASGAVPFNAETPVAVLSQHLHQQPASLRRLALDDPGSIPVGLEVVILTCMAKRPEDRYASMREVQIDLDRVAQALQPRGSGFLPALALNPEAAGTREDSFDDVLVVQPARTNWFLYLVATAVIAGAGLLGLSRLGTRNSSQAAAEPAASNQGTTAVNPMQSSSASATEARINVALVLAPIDAHVYRDKQDLGSMPVNIPLGPGETAELEIRREGYWPRKLVLDASQPKRIVRLAPVLDARPAPPPVPLVIPLTGEDAADAASHHRGEPPTELQELPAPKPKTPHGSAESPPLPRP